MAVRNSLVSRYIKRPFLRAVLAYEHCRHAGALRTNTMKLYDHQKKIIDEDPKKAGLFLGTGSGKTRTALILAKGKTLIIMPKTQFEDENWQRELDTIWKSKIQYDKQIATVTTISKEAFRRDAETLPAFDTVIVDEAHTCLGVTPNTRWRKGQRIPQTSQLFEALESYLKRTSPSRLYLCTATIMRSPMTVWAAAKLLGRKIDYFKFRDQFYVRLPMPFREVYAPRSDDKVKNFLAKIVKNIGYVGRLEDFFDVPEQMWKTDRIELTAKQKKRITELPLEFPDPIVCLLKKNQVENGVLAGNEFAAAETFENGKIEKILDYASEFPRMVIFARYRAQIEQIQKALTKAKYATWTLTGDTKDRGGVIKQASESADGIFICQSQISAGWELKTFPVMIFASRNNSFVDYDQALGRIQRADHIKKNLYIKLIAAGKNSIDEAIDRSLENKQDFNERLYLKI